MSTRTLNFDSSYNPYFSSPSDFGTIHFFNESTVPYLSLWDVVDSLLCYGTIYGGTYTYQGSMDGKVFEIDSTNPNYDGRCYIDPVGQTITFNDRDAYRDFFTYSDCPLSGAIQGGEDYFVGSIFNYTAPKQSMTIDLNKYGIHAYFDNDDVYLPFDVIKAFILPYDLMGDLTFNGEYFYAFDTSGSGSPYYKAYKMIRDEATCFTSEYMEFMYGSLAMNLDYNFGLDKRPLRSQNGTRTYFKDGAMAALQPYHDKLVSTSLNVSNRALIEVFRDLCDDGGHAGYFGATNIFCDQDAEYSYSTIGNEYRQTMTSLSYAGYYRNYFEKSPSQLTGVSSAEAAYVEQDGVAFIVFDGFEAPSSRITDSSVNSNNYYNDTISLTHWANEQIRAHGIKDVVIDLSNNGGGAVYTEEFIASWLCGDAHTGNTSVYRNPKTGAYVKCNIKADVNLNGRYDSGDYLPDDVNVYCIIDNGSFSCGNKLPTDISENRTTYFIGSRSGGGSCCVGEAYTGLGSKIRLSADYQIGMPTATADNFVTNEGGVTADFYNIGNDLNDLYRLYDWNSLISRIKAN